MMNRYWQIGIEKIDSDEPVTSATLAIIAS